MSDGYHKPDDTEFVGAPTEYADVDEVPEWVSNVARILFFLPAAFVTATTIPIILMGIGLLCLLLCGALVLLR
jgi:hypothetical protein